MPLRLVDLLTSWNYAVWSELIGHEKLAFFTGCNPMKKNLLIAAAMTAALASVGLGQRSHAADMFTINANTPGTMTFSGQGTAQFNNSLGSNNSFQVGSSTNLGVRFINS